METIGIIAVFIVLLTLTVIFIVTFLGQLMFYGTSDVNLKVFYVIWLIALIVAWYFFLSHLTIQYS